MKKTVLSLVSLLLTLVLLAACGGGAASSTDSASPVDSTEAQSTASTDEAQDTPAPLDGESMVLKISTDVTEQSVTGQALAVLAKTLDESTGGRVTATIYYSGSLGTYTSVYEMIQEGDIAMWTTNPVAYETQVVELSTLDQYYMFDDLEHAHRFLEGAGGEFINKSWRKINMEALCNYALGFRQLTNSKREVNTYEDLKGLTLRSYSTIQADAWSSVSAVPTSVDWNELFVSMQQKLIDGQEGGIPTINDFSFYEVQSYLTMTDHVFSMDSLLASTVWLDSLSAEDQQIVRDAAMASYEFQKKAYQDQLAELLDKFEKEAGMMLNRDCEDLKTAMKEKMVPATAKGIVELCGQEVYDQVQGFVEEARTA